MQFHDGGISAVNSAGARGYFRKCLTILEAFLAKEPNKPTYFLTMRSNYQFMSDVLLERGEAKEALEVAGKELALADQSLALNPESADAARSKAIALAQLGKAYEELLRQEQAAGGTAGEPAQRASGISTEP